MFNFCIEKKSEKKSLQESFNLILEFFEESRKKHKNKAVPHFSFIRLTQFSEYVFRRNKSRKKQRLKKRKPFSFTFNVDNRHRKKENK